MLFRSEKTLRPEAERTLCASMERLLFEAQTTQKVERERSMAACSGSGMGVPEDDEGKGAVDAMMPGYMLC